MEYKGELKGFPEFVVEAMLDEQEKQGNKRDVSVFEENKKATKLDGGFRWYDSELGAEWVHIIASKNFSLAAELLKPKPIQYYGSNTYEAIKVIEAWELGFNLGNVLKYIKRAGKKTPETLPDLEKALWYLQREINLKKQK